MTNETKVQDYIGKGTGHSSVFAGEIKHPPAKNIVVKTTFYEVDEDSGEQYPVTKEVEVPEWYAEDSEGVVLLNDDYIVVDFGEAVPNDENVILEYEYDLS